jgi:hypothetical protein
MTIIVKDGRAQILKGGMRVGRMQMGALGCGCGPSVRQGKSRLGLIVVDGRGAARIAGMARFGSLGATASSTVQTAPVGSQAAQAASGGTVLVYKSSIAVGSAGTPGQTAQGFTATGLPRVTGVPAPAPVAGTTTPAPSAAQIASTTQPAAPPSAPVAASVPAVTVSVASSANRAAAARKPGTQVNGLGRMGATGVQSATTVLATTGAGLSAGIAASTAATALLGSAAAGAIGGSFFPVVGTVIGAIVGVIAGLFASKPKSPPITAAEQQQAQQFLTSYQSIAGTIVGRAFTQSQIQDLACSFAIVKANPGTQLTQIDLTYVWDEYTARLNQLFTALAGSPVGAQISLSDIKGIPGHPNDFNPNIFYTFTNPGVNAPSDIIGLIFAQLQYSIDCALYVGTKDVPGLTNAVCANLYLAAPYPQFACDLVDWYRSSYPAWDVQGAVVTTQDQTLSLPAPVVTSTPPAPGSPASVGPAATAAANLPQTTVVTSPVSTSTPAVASPVQPIVITTPASVMSSPAVVSPTQQPIVVTAPAASGPSTTTLALIAGAAILAIIATRK